MAQAPLYALNANLIRGRAARACMFLYEVADQAGVAHAHFSRLLGGYEYPSPPTRKKLLGAPLFADLGFDDLFIPQAESTTPRTTKPEHTPEAAM